MKKSTILTILCLKLTFIHIHCGLDPQGQKTLTGILLLKLEGLGGQWSPGQALTPSSKGMNFLTVKSSCGHLIAQMRTLKFEVEKGSM